MVLTELLAPQLWARALECEFGLAIPIKVEDFAIAKNILYDARKKSDIPQWRDISVIITSDHPDEIWLVKKVVSLDV